jgi:hypothetical protein
MNRQRLLLAILLCVLIIALVISYFRRPQQQTVATLKFAPGMRAEVKRPATSSSQDDTKLHLELLDQERQRFSGFKRNIFRPIFHEEGKLLPLPPRPPVLPAPPPPPPPVSNVEQPSPLQQEIGRFIFLGFLKKDGQKTIFLSRDNQIYLVKKGDKLAGKYEVASLTDEALTIRMQGDGGEIVIPLLENRALSAPRR